MISKQIARLEILWQKSLRIPDEQSPVSWHGCVEERLQRALLPIQSVCGKVFVVSGV